jgi:hypothetical protein
VVTDPSRSNRGLTWAETELVRATNEALEERGCSQSVRRPLLLKGFLRELQARPVPPGPKSPPLPDWAAQRIRELGDERVAVVRELAGRGVHLVGDPELMRTPDDVEVAAPPLAPPPLAVDVAAEALASALFAVLDAGSEQADDSDLEEGSEQPDE